MKWPLDLISFMSCFRLRKILQLTYKISEVFCISGKSILQKLNISHTRSNVPDLNGLCKFVVDGGN